jgi:hypothetical protein
MDGIVEVRSPSRGRTKSVDDDAEDDLTAQAPDALLPDQSVSTRPKRAQNRRLSVC